MQTNASQYNGAVARHLRDIKRQSQQRKAMRSYGLLLCVTLLIVLLASLTGCASPSPPPCEPPVAITPPVLPEPMPAVSYSISVRDWLQTLPPKLTGTPATQKP